MNYDIIVIGSGPGGYVGAIRASQLGFKVAIVEKEHLGGICLNWGCIPTKALLKSSQVYSYLQNAGDYGFDLAGIKVDFQKIIARSRGVANKMSKGVQFLMKKNKIEVINGFGRLKSRNQVEVQASDGSVSIINAPHIIVATGARAKSLPNVPLDGKRIISYKEAMNLPIQPKSLIVMGSGAIGVEFAYFYHSIGTKVTIVEYLPHLVPNEDEDISKELERVYKKYGIEVLTSASVQSAQATATGVNVLVKTANGTKNLEADNLLCAVGVAPNIEGIGLETLGVKTDKGKIVVNEYYETNQSGIYGIGDIVHGPALAHVASKEADICVEHIAFKLGRIKHKPQVLDYGNVPGCTYCSPEIASVGYTEKQAIEKGYQVKVGKFPFSASGKASAAGHNDGFVKVIFDAKYGEWLGAHLIGANVTEMITEVTLGRKLETTYQEVLDTIHPHPTMNEAIMEAVAQAYGVVVHL